MPQLPHVKMSIECVNGLGSNFYLYLQDYERKQERHAGRGQLIPRGVSKEVGE